MNFHCCVNFETKQKFRPSDSIYLPNSVAHFYQVYDYTIIIKRVFYLLSSKLSLGYTLISKILNKKNNTVNSMIIPLDSIPV